MTQNDGREHSGKLMEDKRRKSAEEKNFASFPSVMISIGILRNSIEPPERKSFFPDLTAQN